MIDSGNTTIDVVDVDAPTLLQGCDEGIFEQIDWDKIGPKSEWLAGTTSDCGVGTIVYATILSFDEHPMRTIIDMIRAVHASDRGDWIALASFPACAALLGALFCGFAR